MASITIHRGTRQIGGCVTEITAANNRVFIDFGENLPGNISPSLPIEGLTVGDGSKSTLFITHYHGDHIGRLADVLPDVSVYMGKTAKAIHLNLIERTDKEKLPLFERIQTFEPGELVIAGDIFIMPLMIDHSAFDAYMFIIEADGKRVLHTGDFRLHGVRSGKTLFMLKNYAKNIDYIVCEGTTISRSGEPPMSEHKLRRKAAEMMNTAKYVFVMCSSTNIDRIGAFYHANPKGRLFVCDAYQKKQLDTVRQGHADKSDYYDFRYVLDYAPNLDELMTEKGFCMLVRQGEFFQRVMEKFKKKCVMGLISEHRFGGRTIGVYHNFLVIYSMWTGYLDERAKNQGLIDFLKPYQLSVSDAGLAKKLLAPHEYNFHILHTSGHASPEDIKKLYETINPKCGIIPIHTDAPEMFEKLIPDGTIILLDDGEEWQL
jgi:ribonuclease J